MMFFAQMLTAHDDDGMAAASLCVEVSSSNGGIRGGRRGIDSSSSEDDTDMGELVNTGSRIEELVRPAASGMGLMAFRKQMIKDPYIYAGVENMITLAHLMMEEQLPIEAIMAKLTGA